MTALKQMQVRASRALLRYLEALDKERLRKLLAQVLPSIEITALNEAMSYLLESGGEAECALVFRRGAESHTQQDQSGNTRARPSYLMRAMLVSKRGNAAKSLCNSVHLFFFLSP